MTEDRSKLCLAEALAALKIITDATDAYVARGVAHAALFAMSRIVQVGEVPTEEETKAYLHSQGFVSGVTRSGGN